MLSGDNQPRTLAKRGKRMGDGTQFDGFRTRSDDKRNTRLAQLSPWLRRGCFRSTARLAQAGRRNALDNQ
jgi:hypothetical protein